MLQSLSEVNGVEVTPITVLSETEFPAWIDRQTELVGNWLKAQGFKAKSGQYCTLPDRDGNLEAVVYGMAADDEFWMLGSLASKLPAGCYAFDSSLPAHQHTHAAMAWALEGYQFTRYKKSDKPAPQLVMTEHVDEAYLSMVVESVVLVRDLINTPAEDMGPSQLAQAVESVATAHQARFSQIVGDALLAQNFPAIHAVGRAADDAPRLLELRWGAENSTKVTLVGKGVCFDTGGLDLKPPSGMITMKKDMGGAAHVLGLAKMIMMANLPINLRVLIPAVENSVAGNAYRPSDVVTMRNGKTVEVTNTDAEGRLILADALVEAESDEPDLLIDFATLTGAGRVALGTVLPAMFCEDDSLAYNLHSLGDGASDPVWRLPLYEPYRELLKSDVADMINAPLVPYGGCITAALFLKSFLEQPEAWVHFDLMAANEKASPGRPKGGEAQAIRAVFHYLKGWVE